MSDFMQNAVDHTWQNKLLYMVLGGVAGGILVAGGYGVLTVRDTVNEFRSARAELVTTQQRLASIQAELLARLDRVEKVMPQASVITPEPLQEKVAAQPADSPVSGPPLITEGTLASYLLNPGLKARPPLPVPSGSAPPRAPFRKPPAEPEVQPSEKETRTEVAEAGQIKLLDPGAKPAVKSTARADNGVFVKLLEE